MKANQPIVVINSAVYEQPTDLIEAGPDPMPTFIIEGTYRTRKFRCKVGFECDGGDATFEHLYGINVGIDNPVDQTRWDAFIYALDQYEPFTTKFNDLSAAYYG